IINKKSVFAGIVSAGLLIAPAFAADEKEIAELEKQLIQKETQLLEPELRLDQLHKERAKYDGASGWFQGKKKKALDAEIAANDSKVDQLYGEMKTVADSVQKMVFDVAYTFEKHGQYQKAIEYYLKVENRTDKIRYRVASCFKAMADYQQSIKWLLEMSRTDDNLLEVVDCYKLDGRMKESIYWLFEILEPYSANSAELTALNLIEEYDYSNKKIDYPDFARRLSDVYLVKSTQAYQSNFLQATKDYKKAVELLANDMGESPSMVSFSILDRSQNDYRAAIEILDRQKEAAERNFEDKVQRARNDIDEAEHRLRRAQHDAERDYEHRFENARMTLKKAQDALAAVKANTAATPEELQRAQNRVQQAERDLRYIQDNRQEIIRDYLRPYQRDVREARDAYDNLLSRRVEIIEEYIAPYKRKVAEAKAAYERIRAMHEANFNK
ncbi:MAG: hypothetical protein AB1403_19460, partial [Candidatus Riflebacteria bacterium]